MSEKKSEVFIPPSQITKSIRDYQWRISFIGVTGSGASELALFFTDEPWDSVARFAEGALKTSCEGATVSTVLVFGSPDHAPADIYEKFRIASPPYPQESCCHFTLPLFG